MSTERDKIVLVHSGNLLPNYLSTCIYQAMLYGPEIHLLVEKQFASELSRHEIKVTTIEDIADNDYFSFNLKGHDLSFRDNFWTRTTSRFLLLRNYARKHGLSNFWHIENDVLLFSKLNRYASTLDGIGSHMGLVIDAPNRCVPSIMWFKNIGILEELCGFLMNNPDRDDMSNLAYFHNANGRRTCGLPTTPSHKNFELFGSCFDGAAIGQFLGGTHQGGIKSKGFINETTHFNPAEYEYTFVKGEPYIVSSCGLVKINNLHIHSKELQYFLEIYG